MTDTTPNLSRNYRTIVITKGIRGPSVKWEDIKKPLFIAAGNTKEEARNAIDAASQDTVTYILNNYSLKGHKHVISDVLGLSTALSDKLSVSHLGTGGDAHALVNPSEAGFMSPQDFTKLNNIENESTKNSSDAFLLDRSNHTGTQEIATIENLNTVLFDKLPLSHEGSGGNAHSLVTTNLAGFMSPDSFNKLSLIEEEATKNKDDSFLLNRENHTGVQSISTIDNLTSILNNKEPANVNIQSHISSTGNPHGLTKDEIGLGNVNNTSDENKSVDSILSKDTRGVNKTPIQEKPYAITFNLKNYADVNSPPVTNGFGYAHIINIAGGDTGNISSGVITQLSTGPKGLAYRCATSPNEWGSWYKFYSSKDIIPEANGGTGVSTLKGKVLDDPVIVSDGDIDGLTTPGGYLFDTNPANGFLVGSAVLVSAVDGYTLQQLLSPIFGVIQMRYHDGAAWKPYVTSVTNLSVQQWYSDTTAEAPNAVINSDGSFSRSLFVPAPLAPKITVGLTADNNTDILRPSALTAATTFPNPTGTPMDGFGFVIELTDDGTARALTWGSDYAAGFAALPTTTTAGKLGQIAIQYRDGKYRCDGVRWMV